MKIEGDKLVLLFKHVGGGLVNKSKHGLESFAVAGQDRKFFKADAKIVDEAVVVSSPLVRAPVAARYAWANNPEASLFNQAGLPASPFRTDTWEPPMAKGVTKND